MDKYNVGDVVRLKKKHPCGSSEWEILMIARKLVEKNTKEIHKKLET